MTIPEKLNRLPSSPGVYIMRDKSGTIIYIGKAKNLKNRVRQYFHESANHTPKVIAMVLNIADFEYIVVDNEYEALCLESNLIKQNKPKYNILLKDDKHYPYLKVTIKNEFPQLKIVRKIENDGARYFGPYPGKGTVKNTVDAVRRIFKIQHCKKRFPRDIGKERPCLYHTMGRCMAPCSGKIDQAEYKRQFDEICDFLEGDHAKLIKKIEDEMYLAAEKLEFEKAASFRNRLEGIKKLDESQKVISEKGRDIDVIAIAEDDNIAAIRIFFVRGGKMTGDDTYREKNAVYLEKENLTEDFLHSYYDGDTLIPDIVICGIAKESAESFSRWLSEKKGKNVVCRNPERGELRALYEMAQKNASISLSQYKIDILTKNNKEKALSELSDVLCLSEKPMRIEAYDISNTSGTGNVGSMVVFTDGKPDKNEYKRFKIKYIVGSNDYDCMREVLSRRFLRYHDKDVSFSKLPDMILIDGGTGHLSAALEALKNLAIDVPVFGMVKDDRHRTRGLVGESGEVSLSIESSAMRLIAHIQDEAHRFAITYHKELRGKKTFESSLDGISGVGEKRKKALMKHFKSINKIKAATTDELEEVDGINNKTAMNIYEYFKNN